MDSGKIDRLIINSPFTEPAYHWRYESETKRFKLKEGRRPAGYVIASKRSKAFDDPGIFVDIPLVNQIRPRVKAWREARYPGVSGITRRLLEHWYEVSEREDKQFFFCQLEAIETLIWLTEAPAADKVGIEIPSDGGPFTRLCCKMATGSGKTVVMAMLIAWQILNKVTYPQDTRFSKNVFVVAPGLTVKSRLEVLMPTADGNYYDEFKVVPGGLREKLRQGKIMVKNWHALNWESYEQIKKKRSVDKRGVKSDEAYVREVLEDMAGSRNILVINDEGHHAWRVNVEAVGKYLRTRDLKDSAQEATVWVGGLDRINKARGILSCYDFSATPFSPSGKQAAEEALFDWIVSDFSLNDAIESGLVKTPRVVVRDDAVPSAKDYKSKLYHIYEHVKDDLNRRAKEHEPLPDLVVNAYHLLGIDWRDTAKAWEEAGHKTPPVMITVGNRTETAARVRYAFEHNKIHIDELCDPDRLLHIDSKVLEFAESHEEALEIEGDSESENEEEAPRKRRSNKRERAEELRRQVDTVGKPGEPGEKIQSVISVGMLSEGWDAKTVTHIMGLRAFSSQLLCEQVVGRGLRRTSYEINTESGLFDAEYVNIFGVPFTFLPHETAEEVVPPPPKPKTLIQPDPAKREFEITWPNVIRIEYVYRPTLSLDMDKVEKLELNAANTPTLAELAPTIEGKPDMTKISEITLEELAQKFRMQKIIFETARDIFDEMKASWKGKGNKEVLLAQLIRLVEGFLESDRISIIPALFERDDLKRRLMLTLNMSSVVKHIWEAIRFENAEKIEPQFDPERPIRSTGDMIQWYTGKPCEHTKKSHINFCVYDSTWEAAEAFHLDHNSLVEAWVKNDHLGFEIPYIYKGEHHKYRPDFIIKLSTGSFLVLETKGKETDQDKTKRKFLDEWVRAVNEHGGFGQWKWAVSKDPGDVADILEKKFSLEEVKKKRPQRGG
ncbi:MAG: DEAD/DEAH box helicase family protein [Deltaproteobacteria bacterium]|nr:DEAD/DEAH box helicase family protein [Deltaproteobacteria bacterium]